ncbi:dihydrofolate reductase family protein [Spirosoma sp. RP8]|uniref:Dihydrofolate reductase family protein n=1 Tax=Spirosoma liriopis TaxID=2937440 RepID=A0ABT0HFC3_9BACT|nr:dihydrofolate reductase family protein [Spirosoma liriopis]MCK8490872.1 dihydrofolate reductase family protein [Spirosoma liriopis]
MRKVKLQMQLSLDGFVAGPNGEMDWLVWNWDDTLNQYVTDLTESVDCILLGRNLAQGFIPAWASRAQNPETADAGTHKMNDLPKVVFSKTLDTVEWTNVTLANGDITEEVNQLKQLPGKDLILYGGAELASSFIQRGLIDEYHLFINPTALGSGMTIFKKLTDRLSLRLIKSQSFSCGIVALHYEPVRDSIA